MSVLCASCFTEYAGPECPTCGTSESYSFKRPEPKRIQRKRHRGWRMPAGTVYVGRPSRWGNPYRLGSEDAAWAVRQFEDDLRRSLAGIRTPGSRSFLLDRFGHPDLLSSALDELAGKDLVCWCREDAEWCHADVLLKQANMPADVNDRAPNFRDQGQLFLVRCYVCRPLRGRENAAVAVADGVCAWCGWRQP